MYDGYVVSTHSRLKAAGLPSALPPEFPSVSTHSRLKAAGIHLRLYRLQSFRFNTQPPEGGWIPLPFDAEIDIVSTHSRLKAAGNAH